MILQVDTRRLREGLEDARRRIQKLGAHLAKRKRQERRSDYRRLQREHDRLGRARWAWQHRGGNFRPYPLLRGRR